MQCLSTALFSLIVGLPNHDETPVSVIVGVVVGFILPLVVIISVCVAFYIRRRKKWSDLQMDLSQNGSGFQNNAFDPNSITAYEVILF